MIKNIGASLLKYGPKLLQAKQIVDATRPATGSGAKQVSKKKFSGIDLEKLPPHVVTGVTDLVGAVTDYLKIAEQEETKRTNIRAQRDLALADIRSRREVFSELMQHTFKERAAVLQKQFDALDRALDNGDVTTVQAALSGMVTVIQSTPFRSAEELHKAMGSKDFVVRLE